MSIVESLKGCSHCSLPTAIFLMQQMCCMGFKWKSDTFLARLNCPFLVLVVLENPFAGAATVQVLRSDRSEAHRSGVIFLGMT